MDLATRRAVIRVRLDKAHDDLTTAQANLGLSLWRGAVNRAYYSIFHVSSAALLWLNVDRRKHSAIQSSFSEFLIKPGLIEAEYGRIYKSAREWREDQDYSDEAKSLDEAMAAKIVRDAERFLGRLELYLREQGAIE